jgi:hypothetical protein
MLMHTAANAVKIRGKGTDFKLYFEILDALLNCYQPSKIERKLRGDGTFTAFRKMNIGVMAT